MALPHLQTTDGDAADARSTLRWIGWRTVAVGALAAGLVGCHSSSTWSPRAETDTAATPKKALSIPIREESEIVIAAPLPDLEASPDQVASAFLGAVRDGQGWLASRLLIPPAQEALRNRGLELHTPGRAAASFHVAMAEFEHGRPDTAYVRCQWRSAAAEAVSPSPIDAEQRHQFYLTLEREADNGPWRVAGLVTHTRGESVIFDFRRPEPCRGLGTPT